MITMIMMNSISIENNSNMDKKTILSKKTSTLVYQIILNPKNQNEIIKKITKKLNFTVKI